MDREGVEELVSLEDVQRIVLSSCLPLGSIEIGLGDALGSVLAGDLHAPEDLPPFANSAMDGYAVRGGRHEGCARRAFGHRRPPGRDRA